MSFREEYGKYLKTNDLYKLLVEETPLFLVVISSEGKVLTMNKLMLDLLGYKEEEAVGKKYLETFVPREDWPITAPMFKRHEDPKSKVLSEKVFNENRIIGKNGKRYFVEWHGRNIADADGNLVFSMGCGFDVTERKKTADALQKAFVEIESLKNKLEIENSALKKKIRITSLGKIVGNSSAVREILQRIALISNNDSTVLILGETGTGKEMVAEAIHDASNRSTKALVKVNCPAIPETLFESELFGHVQGAFSGATSTKQGKIHAADGGTLLLDEIGEIPLSVQVKLLRFLESKEYERVGENKINKANVKIIASTNADLEKLVEQGKFRADLLYRLRVATLTLPPLRERKEDIQVLINDFLSYYNNLFSKKVLFPQPNVLEFLMNYDWPGNIRELRHVVEHACIYCPESYFKMEHLPEYMLKDKTRGATSGKNRPGGKIDRNRLIGILNQCKWNKTNAAEMLGVHRCTLYRLMDKHGISRQ